MRSAPRCRQRYSLANSAGICLGRDYSFDLVRPGPPLYGGVPRREAEDNIRQAAPVEAQIVQRRTIRAGETCGYGATFTAEATPRPRSSTSAMPTAICAAFPPAGRRSPANCAAGARPGIDGPDRRRLRRREGPQGRRLGRVRLRPAELLRSSPAFRSTSVDNARFAVRAALGLARSSGGGVFGL